MGISQLNGDLLTLVKNKDNFQQGIFEKKFFEITKKDDIDYCKDLFHKGGLPKDKFLVLTNSEEIIKSCQMCQINTEKITENTSIISEYDKNRLLFIDFSKLSEQ